MGFDGGQLKRLHYALGSSSATLNTEANNAAGAVGKILLSHVVVLVAREAAVVNVGNLLMAGKELCHSLTVFAMALHAHVNALDAEVQ